MVRQNPRPHTETLEPPRIADTLTAPIPLLAGASRELAHGRTTVVFPRRFAESPPRIWTLLTDPGQLALWSPFTSDRDLSHVGRATIRMLDNANTADGDIPSVVFVADAPRILEYSWADDAVSWTLEADAMAGETVLVLRQTLANAALTSAVAAGWHLCLDVAQSVLDGHPVPPIRGAEAMNHGWVDLNRRYARLLGVKPTRIV